MLKFASQYDRKTFISFVFLATSGRYFLQVTFHRSQLQVTQYLPQNSIKKSLNRANRTRQALMYIFSKKNVSFGCSIAVTCTCDLWIVTCERNPSCYIICVSFAQSRCGLTHYLTNNIKGFIRFQTRETFETYEAAGQAGGFIGFERLQTWWNPKHEFLGFSNKEN